MSQEKFNPHIVPDLIKQTKLREFKDELRLDKLRDGQLAAAMFDAEVTFIPSSGLPATYVKDGLVHVVYQRQPKRSNHTRKK